MMNYRKKPVVIEAIQYTGHNRTEIFQWCNSGLHPANNTVAYHDGYVLHIRTLEGEHIASEGDFIIRGVKGEFYPCKPDIFEMTYEPVGELT